MKRWSLLSLRTQILIFFVLAIFLIIFTMGITLFFSTSKIIREDTLKTTTTAIEKSGGQLEMYIDKLKGLSELLATNPQVCRYLDDKKETEIQIYDKSDIESLIKSIISTDESIESVFIVGNNNKVLTNEEHLDMDFSGKIMEQTWYKETVESKMPILSSARMQEFSMDKNDWVISLGKEIENPSGEQVGIVRIDLRYTAIETSLKDLNLGSNGYVFIINDKNEVVYHKDSRYFTDDEKKSELIDILEMNNKELMEKNILTHTYKLKNTDWQLVGVATLDSVIKMQQDIIIALWILGIILLLVAFGSSIIFTRGIIKPINKLELKMTEIEVENISGNINIVGSAEIASLSKHFTNMLQKIGILMNEIKEKEESIRASELKVLHSQINPHFIYNTLDTIVWMAEMGNAEKVVDISKAMASFFRLSLRGGSELTTIREELDHVRQYLIIQKERYMDKLSFEIIMDDEIADISIPKIILQPLAENAIYHGIRFLTGNGMIKIKAEKIKNEIILTVEDNGVGFDIGKPYKKENSSRLGGVGLQNVDERIHLYYGQGSGLDIFSEIGIGTKVTVKIKI